MSIKNKFHILLLKEISDKFLIPHLNTRKHQILHFHINKLRNWFSHKAWIIPTSQPRLCPYINSWTLSNPPSNSFLNTWEDQILCHTKDELFLTTTSISSTCGKYLDLKMWEASVFGSVRKIQPCFSSIAKFEALRYLKPTCQLLSWPSSSPKPSNLCPYFHSSSNPPIGIEHVLLFLTHRWWKRINT